MSTEKTNEFISISEAVKRYDVSSTKIRKIIKDKEGSEHTKKIEIKGKHGFKYVVSTSYLNELFTPVNRVQTGFKQSSNEDKTGFKQGSNEDNQLNSQLNNENKQLYIQLNQQNEIITSLTSTVKDLNKVIVAQAMQVHQLASSIGEDQGPKKTATIEYLIVTVLVICIIVIIIYLLTIEFL
jgi:hypothetical protein